MYVQLDSAGINVLKTLASDTRIDIIKILSLQPSTVSEIAKQLNLSKSIVSRHMRLIEDAGLIKLKIDKNDTDNRTKKFALVVDHLDIDFPKKIHLPFNEIVTNVNLGLFSNFDVIPTCGLVSNTSIIGEIDDPRSFVSNERSSASLLWFSDGYVEYLIPNELPKGAKLELLELSLELSSEFPESNDTWPSDIFFAINDTVVGTWTAPGNFSDVRGRLTPKWWHSTFSQYGLLKHIRITDKDTGIDGKKISDVNLDSLNISQSPFIKIRIGIDPLAENKGGVTIFGQDFGNHPQNIVLKMYYSDENKPDSAGK